MDIRDKYFAWRHVGAHKAVRWATGQAEVRDKYFEERYVGAHREFGRVY